MAPKRKRPQRRTAYTAAEKLALKTELVRRYQSGNLDYRGPDGLWNLAWDVGLPYPTATKWLRLTLAKTAHRR